MNRIISLEYLRGVAALMVLYGHVVVVGTTDIYTPKLFLPFLTGAPLDFRTMSVALVYLGPEIAANAIRTSLGHIGVSLFFFISGFVIVRSIETLGVKRFAIGRFFRIIPLCVVVTFGSAAFFGLRYGSPLYAFDNTVTSAFLVSGLFGKIQIIPVLWSLIVETWFYVLIAALFAWRGKIDNIALLTGGGYCVALTILGGFYPDMQTFVAPIMRHIAYNASFILQIMVGSAIYNYWRGEKHSIPTAAALFAAFCGTRLVFDTYIPYLGGYHIPNAIIGLALFAAGLLVEKRIGRSRIAGFFADISYPLYLAHVPLAWLLIVKFGQYGFGTHLTFLATTAVCIFTAWLLHVLIENPANSFGKRVARWIKPNDVIKRTADQPQSTNPSEAASTYGRS